MKILLKKQNKIIPWKPWRSNYPYNFTNIAQQNLLFGCYTKQQVSKRMVIMAIILRKRFAIRFVHN